MVDYRYVLRIPDALPSDSAAPLLCECSAIYLTTIPRLIAFDQGAGITMFSALRHWKTGPDSRVAIIGIGGLGHVGVKLAPSDWASSRLPGLCERAVT